jgi:hypothetical protein
LEKFRGSEGRGSEGGGSGKSLPRERKEVRGSDAGCWILDAGSDVVMAAGRGITFNAQS